MANKVKIQTVSVGRFNKSFNYTPEVGVITFDEDGVAEIDEKHLDSVIEMDSTVTLAGEGKAVDLNNKGGIDDVNEYKRELNKMKKEDLIKLAEDAELPVEEYQDLNKVKLIDYLYTNIQEQE